jgi:hypothetical protein
MEAPILVVKGFVNLAPNAFYAIEYLQLYYGSIAIESYIFFGK